MKRQAFTLVELIVVITILAILGIISFISLQGYSKEARDSKRITDVRNLLNKINIENTKGVPFSSLVTKNKTATGQILGVTGREFQTMGEVNFETLKENPESFEDPSTKRNYPIAYAVGGSGTGAYNFVQIATISEKDNTTRIQGNYYTLTAGDIPSLFVEGGKYYEEGKEPIYDVNKGSSDGGNTNEETTLNCPENPTERKYFVFSNVTGMITDYTGTETDVVIPCKILGVKVTSIGSLAFQNNQLTSVVIPDSITSIGGFAFQNNQLTSITIPNSVTSIGKGAFQNNQLTSITIPSSVTSIGSLAFLNNQLTSITNYDGSISNEYIYLSYDGGIGIYEYFGSDKDVSIPETINGKVVKSIGEMIFQSKQLTSVVIPNGVTSIGFQAFYDNQLTSVIIPDSVTSIGDTAFQNNQLTSVVIPDSITSIGSQVFQNNQLTSITIPNSVISIGNFAFQNNQLTSITIPNSVTSIGNFAFIGQINSLGNGTIYGPQSLRDTYYNSTYFDTAKLTQWVVQ